MDDLISRQAFDKFLEDAEKEAVKHRKYVFASALNTIRGNLRNIPSAEPERKKGWWMEINESDCSGYDPALAGYDDPVVGYVCSCCGDGHEKETMGKKLWNFCPNCGSYNGGEQDEVS